MPYQTQGIDLPSIFLAAQQARANEQASQLNALRLQEAQRQADAQRWLPQARLDYMNGDATDLMRLAPEEAAQLQQSQLARQQAQAKIAQERAAASKTAEEAARARQSNTWDYASRLFEHAYRNPDAWSGIVQEARGLAEQGVINDLALPDVRPPDEQIAAFRDRMRAAAAPAPTNEIQNARFAAGGNEAEAANILRKKMQSSGVNVNVGEKTLPTTVVQEMGDAQTALNILSDVGGAFGDAVPSASFFEQLKSRGEQYVPNTKTANYLNDVASAAQVVGFFLEGGKLSESDLPRYTKMFPLPGDSPQTAQQKLDNLARKIRLRAANRNSSLKSAGYKIPDMSTLISDTPPQQGSQSPAVAPLQAPTAAAPTMNQRTAALREFIQGSIGKDPTAVLNEARLKGYVQTPEEIDALAKRLGVGGR